MNINTIDPFLYHGQETDKEIRMKNYSRSLGEGRQKAVENTQNFLEELNKSINASIPESVRQTISSNIIHRNMNREQVRHETENSPDKRKLYEAAKEFESFFVEKMFVEMKKNVPKNEMFHGGYAEDVFDDMLLSERIRKVSGQTEFGLAEMMYQQLSVVYS